MTNPQLERAFICKGKMCDNCVLKVERGESGYNRSEVTRFFLKEPVNFGLDWAVLIFRNFQASFKCF